MEKIKGKWEFWLGVLFLIGAMFMVFSIAFEMWELSRYGQLMHT